MIMKRSFVQKPLIGKFPIQNQANPLLPTPNHNYNNRGNIRGRPRPYTGYQPTAKKSKVEQSQQSKPQREYCKTCDVWLTGIPYEQHRISDEHNKKFNMRLGPSVPDKAASSPASVKTPLTSSTVVVNLASKPATPIVVTSGMATPDQPTITTSATPSNENTTAMDDTLEVTASDMEIPKFVVNKSYGKEQVISVAGYFCRLCIKYFSTEKLAFEEHCSSKEHYDKYVKLIQDTKTELIKPAEKDDYKFAKPVAVAPKASPVVVKSSPVAPKVSPVAPKISPVAPKASHVAPKVSPLPPKKVSPLPPKFQPGMPRSVPAKTSVVANKSTPVTPKPAVVIKPITGPEPHGNKTTVVSTTGPTGIRMQLINTNTTGSVGSPKVVPIRTAASPVTPRNAALVSQAKTPILQRLAPQKRAESNKSAPPVVLPRMSRGSPVAGNATAKTSAPVLGQPKVGGGNGSLDNSSVKSDLQSLAFSAAADNTKTTIRTNESNSMGSNLKDSEPIPSGKYTDLRIVVKNDSSGDSKRSSAVIPEKINDTSISIDEELDFEDDILILDGEIEIDKDDSLNKISPNVRKLPDKPITTPTTTLIQPRAPRPLVRTIVGGNRTTPRFGQPRK